MSQFQADNRNSPATKRARTDDGRREDDWICPSCRNVNFSFRTTCNMRNCTQSRPANHNLKSVAKPMQSSHFSPSAPYVGSGAASSMYVGFPPYGSSMYDGSPLPRYEVPFAGGSAYPYNYGDLFSRGSPYNHFPLSEPSPYSGGSMVANDGMYGAFPLVDRYGLRMSSVGMGPLPGFYPDEEFQKKDAKRDNDWKCPNCGNVNFAFRTVCNMRSCNTAKPGPKAAISDQNSKQKIPEGSWKCDQCNNINYPYRTKCNKKNCGADKPSEENNSPSETYRNDQ